MTVTYGQWQQHRRCDRKVRHATLYDARRAVLLLWKAGKPGAAYHCADCAGWHTTTDPAPRDPEVRTWA